MGSIVHKNIYDEILRGVNTETYGSIPQCYYIVGRKGYGKTSLLINLLKELSKSQQIYPLYIDSILTPTFDLEKTINMNKVNEKRLVLLIDDIDIILKSLDERSKFNLRSLLYKEGAPIIIGTGTNLIPDFTDYHAPFYDAFILYNLKELTVEESLCLFENMRIEMGLPMDHSKIILEALDEIGKTPRACSLLSKLKSFDSSLSEVLSEALSPLDLYYREKIFTMPLSQRKTFVYILSQGKSVLLSDIRKATEQSSGDITPQLKSLANKGLIITTKESAKKTEYSVADKMMCAWYKYCRE
jgi:hypothetical protein